MSWILRHKRRLAIYVLALLALVVVVTPLWPLSLLFWVGVAAIVLDRRIPVYDHRVMSHLHGRQQIRKIDTLIIGDTCRESFLAQYAQGETLAIQHPDRGLDSSYQIFMHVESLLEHGGHLVIFNDSKVEQHAYSIFDLPFIYWVHKKELGIAHLDAATRHPLFNDPIRSIKILLRVKKNNYKQLQCPKQELTLFCRERKIDFIYLER